MSSSDFGGVYQFSVIFCCLYFNAYSYIPALLENYLECLALELVGSWVKLGFSVGIEAFG